MQSRTLTEEEIVTYRESGFIKAGGIVSSDELDRFAGAVDNEIEKGRVRDVSGPKEGQSATFSVLVEGCIQEPGINFMVDHPGIVGAVECLLGGPARLSSFSIHIKRPGWLGTDGDYEGTHGRRHCDYKPFRPVGSSMNWLFTIIPLVDCIGEIGPLLVSPGSHRCFRTVRYGRVTKGQRAKGTEIPEFVDTELKRGEVLFMDGFTWHEAYPNRSDRNRIGIYNKYMAANAPPGCGPYLFSDRNYNVIKSRGSDLLNNHSNRLIASTRLILECRDRVLFLKSKNGLMSLPGGSAQTKKKISGSNDDNVIEHLYASLKEQLGIEFPWVSYVGDFADNGNGDLCRVYAYPELAESQIENLNGKDVAWLGEAEISSEARNGKLELGFELDAVRRWLHEPLLRGIGQSRSQVT